MMKKLALILTLFISSYAFSQSVYPKILLKTSFGNIKIMLYDDTPLHSENFVKLVKDGFYDDLLFHRVISNFMIQTGDPNSKNAPAGTQLGRGDVGYLIPPEIKPNYYHKKGALAAARQPDQVNPEKKSSGCQFYIVQGQAWTQAHIDMFTKRGRKIPFTEDQIKTYKTTGGTPHLDYEYTVFGEVIEGLEVVDKIASQETDKNDRPIENISIQVSIIK